MSYGVVTEIKMPGSEAILTETEPAEVAAAIGKAREEGRFVIVAERVLNPRMGGSTYTTRETRFDPVPGIVVRTRND